MIGKCANRRRFTREIFAGLAVVLLACIPLAGAAVSVVSHVPSRMANHVSPSADIAITFSDDMSTPTLNNTNILVHGSLTGVVSSSSFLYNAAGKTVTLHPDRNFNYGEVVTVALLAGVKDHLDTPLIPYQYKYRIGTASEAGRMDWKEYRNFSAYADPVKLIPGDFDHDGQMDFVAILGNLTYKLAFYHNNGDRTFTENVSSFNLGSVSGRLEAADFDRDGNLDVMVAGKSPNRVDIYRNNGSGVFSLLSSSTTTAEPKELSVGDFDGDGALDFAFTGSSSYAVYVYRNNGSNSFSLLTSKSLSSNGQYALFEDVNNDGKLDVLAQGGTDLFVFTNNGDGTLTQLSRSYYNIVQRFAAADAKQDGNADIYMGVINSPNLNMRVYQGDGAGAFTQSDSSIIPSNYQPFEYMSDDFNSDGYPDVLIINAFTNTPLTAWRNDGAGNLVFQGSYLPNRTNYVAAMADFDGDGDLDIIDVDYNTKKLVLALDDEPTAFSAVAANPTYVEDSSAVTLFLSATITDGDETNLRNRRLTVSLQTNGQTGDSLAIRNEGAGPGQLGISGSVITYGGVEIGTFSEGNYSTPLTIDFTSDNASLEAVQSVMTHLTYEHTTNNPNQNTRTISCILSHLLAGTQEGTASGAVVVQAINDPPVAEADSYSGTEDQPLSVAAPGVLSNDHDPDNSSIQAILDTPPSPVGSFQLNSDGAFNLVPAANYSGTIQFTYHAFDGNSPSASATVSVQISPVTDAPLLAVSPASGAMDTFIPLSITASLQDTDGSEQLTITIDGIPSGAQHNAGTPGGPGAYEIPSSSLAGLAIKPPFGNPYDFCLRVTASAREISSSETQQVMRLLPVQVIGSSAGPFSGFADSGQRLSTSNVSGVSLADLDGDGDLDAFLSCLAGGYDPPNRVLLNDGNGFFSDSGQAIGSNAANRVVLGDLNGDGFPDALEINGFGLGNRVYFNDGTGHFADSGQYLGNQSGSDGALGDLDNDGDLDAYVANIGPGTSRPDIVYFNNGYGVFSVHQLLGNSVSNAVALGDVDGDGDMDAVAATSSGHNDVWINDGSGNFSAGAQVLGSYSATAVAMGDVDGDGDLDVALGGAAFQKPVFLWINDGTGNFSESSQFLGSSVESENVLFKDIDGDDDEDLIAVTYSSSARSTIWLNDGSGNFSLFLPPVAGGIDIACGDLNGDLSPDLFIAEPYGSGCQVWINGGLAAPTLTENEDLTVLRGESAALTQRQLHVLDSDTPPSAIQYSIVALPLHGTLMRNGTAMTTLDNTFTQEDINMGRISYRHAGFSNAQDIFSFTVTADSQSLTGNHCHINVINKNQWGNSICISDGLGILCVDRVTGNRAVVSDWRRGEGPPFFCTAGLIWKAPDTLYLFDAPTIETGRIFRVDIRTGNRTIIAATNDGLGPEWKNARHADLDENGNLVFPSTSLSEVILLNPATGYRQIISSDIIGTGPTPISGLDAAVQSTGSIYVASSKGPMLVDPATGNRTLIASLYNLSGLAINWDNMLLAYLLAGDYPALYQVNPLTGAVTLVSGAFTGGRGSGPALPSSSDVEIGYDGTLYAAGNNTVIGIDPLSGDRQIVSSNSVGSGPLFRSPLPGGGWGISLYPEHPTQASLTWNCYP